MFSLSFSTYAKGVMTLIHKSIPFQVTKLIKDKAGKYLIVQGSLLTENLNLVNISVLIMMIQHLSVICFTNSEPF